MDHEIQIGFGHTVEMSNGSRSESHIAMTLYLPSDTPIEDVRAKAKETSQEIKALVYTELGVKFNTEEETGRIVELFPGAVPVAHLPEPISQTQENIHNHLSTVPPPEPALHGFGMPEVPLPDPATITTWLEKCWYALVTQPDLWIDQRDARKGDDRPDFKAKSAEMFPQDGLIGTTKSQGLWVMSKYGPPPAWAVTRIP